MTINKRILEILGLQKNFSQKNLSEYIGISTSTVNNWLKLGRSIPAEYIIPISEYLNVDSHYLLTGEKNIKNISPHLTDEDEKFLNLIHQLTDEKRYELIGYIKRMLDESVAADNPLKKTGTENKGN